MEVAARRGAPQPNKNNDLIPPTRQNSPFDPIGDFSGLSNLFPTQTNENPGALAGATGVRDFTTGIVSTEYRKRAEAATSLCLAIGNCDPQDACLIMEAALLDLGPGQPFPPLFSIMDAARDWAEWASVPELKAFAAACFEQMRPKVRAAFLRYAQRAVAV